MLFCGCGYIGSPIISGPTQPLLLETFCMSIRPILLSLLLLSVVLTGCRPDAPITVDLIPKDRSGIQWMRDLGESSVNSTGASDGKIPDTSPADPTRMVVAIFQRAEAAWFFKITGSPETVAKSESDWKPFIEAVKFESGGGNERPVWDLPEGWSVGGKAQMVFAILKMPDTDAEVRISRLGGQQDLLSNVNRWRGQLGLPPATDDTLDDNLSLGKGKGTKYRMFDQEGKSAGGSMSGSMGGPFMQRQAMLQAQKAAESADPENAVKGKFPDERAAVKPPEKLENDFAANPKFTLDPPDGFSPGKTSAMVVARFTKETDDGKVQISVVPLTPTNQWNDNVNFWRQSVGMEQAEGKEIESASEAITISGIDGKKIELFPSDVDAKQSLIGVMVKRTDAAWFFKMMGDSELVEAEKSTFEDFLQSFKFADAP